MAVRYPPLHGRERKDCPRDGQMRRASVFPSDAAGFWQRAESRRGCVLLCPEPHHGHGAGLCGEPGAEEEK